MPAWTAEEASEYIEDEYGHELRQQINGARCDVRRIERVVKDRDFRPLVQRYESFHRGDYAWSFQRFMEDCLAYDRFERKAKEAIESARVHEMEANLKREYAARCLNEQNDILLNMFHKGLHRDIQQDIRLQRPQQEGPEEVEIIRIAGSGESVADPVEILD